MLKINAMTAILRYNLPKIKENPLKKITLTMNPFKMGLFLVPQQPTWKLPSISNISC
jgi:hypothetical protein